MLRFRKFPLVLGALVVLGLLAPGSVSGAPLIVELTAGPTPVAGGFSYSYSISSTSPDEVVNDTDFFTIYDFAGYVAGSAVAPAGWTVSVQNLGINVPLVSPTNPDNPTIPNLTFTAVGNKGVVNNLGGFTATSVFGATVLGSYTSLTTNAALGNTDIGTTARVTVPTPEPSTMLLALAGPVFLFGAVRRGLRRKQG
jgi:hypothetical protein